MGSDAGQQSGSLQGLAVKPSDEQELLQALEQAFDYRGDVTITRTDRTELEGYIFDRRTGATLATSFVKIIPARQNVKLTLPYSEIAGLTFSGRDSAAGKSWEAWVKKYLEKKAAGETGIELKPENLD